MAIAGVKSATTLGLDPRLVEIEADLSNGLPTFMIVGLPDKAVEESKERVRAAIKNSGLSFPQRKITVNLAPADLKKEGPSFDLAVAVSLLCASEQVPRECQEGALFVGELALDGRLRYTRGILPIVHFAKKSNLKKVYIPTENVAEAVIIKGIEVIPVETLLELYWHLKGEKLIEAALVREIEPEDFLVNDFDISYIKGQEHAKRALEIAAAGGHNILLSGPPGSGKTMLAKSLATILPKMDFEEIIETTKIHSVAGLLNSQKSLVTTRPFRSPHHTSSDISLVGGGRWPKPGEITLAHRGVLFLDELPEFSRSVLEVLRQPLEDGRVNISRASGSLSFPAKFILVASQNPCPCGFFGDPKKECSCTPTQIERYQRKISGPLLDRIDLHLEVPRVEVGKLASKRAKEGSEVVRIRVERARELQRKRFMTTGLKTNSEMSSKQVDALAAASSEALELLRAAAENLGLSARSYFKIIKIARTIADLANSSTILEAHLAEALQYRPRN